MFVVFLISMRYTGRMSFSRLSRCWLRDSSVLVLSIQVTNENAGGSATCIHKDLLREDALVTHMITYEGRDHFVNMKSGRKRLVIVNVHYEPDFALRRLREKFRSIAPHWPSYPNVVGIFLGDWNICEPEEGRFNVWNQTFTDVETGKTALFHSLFPHLFEMDFSTWLHKEGLLSYWGDTHDVKDCSFLFFEPTHHAHINDYLPVFFLRA